MTSGSAPCIVGWSALSPLGADRVSFVDGFVAGRTGRLASAGQSSPVVGYRVDGADAAAFIGSQGSRTVDRMTSMVIAAATSVLDEHRDSIGDSLHDIGLVLGTSTGSINSITEFLRDTFVQAKPYFVKPADFPNTVMNGAAGRTAIWHGLRGLNSTVAGGHVTGLAALRYATRMIRRGYANTLLVGAVEELSPPIAWAASRIRGPVHGPGAVTPLGEGCVMFLLDDAATARERGRKPLAEIVDFSFTTVDPRLDPAAQSQCLTEGIQAVLGRAGVRADELWAVSLAQSGDGPLDRIEADGVAKALGATVARRIVAAHQVGNTFSALGAFQVAALLAAAEREPGSGRPALSTAVGVDGAVACALLRL